MIEKIENIFEAEELNKEALVKTLKMFIPNFSHIEKGKSLDQKM